MYIMFNNNHNILNKIIDKKFKYLLIRYLKVIVTAIIKCI
jgi:hypothetical protein